MRSKRSASGRAGRLEEAVAAYREALQELTRASVPLEWADTQVKLGHALATLGTRENSGQRISRRPLPLFVMPCKN
jgi:hypothetical protein